ESKKRLAVLDVEGIIIPKRRYLLLQASKNLNFYQILHVFLLGFFYEIGFLTLEASLTQIYSFFKGSSREDLFALFKAIPIIPKVPELFQTLKANGYEIALISSGIPDFLVQSLSSELHADYAYGLRLEFVNGQFTGVISGEVLGFNGKAKTLDGILKKRRISKDQCIVIADDRNNLSMFELCSTSIGYNPDSFLAIQSDHAIKGSLQEIIPIIDASEKTVKSTHTTQDTYREAIHMGSFLIPILCQYFNVNRYLLAAFILLLTIGYTLSELARRAGINMPPFTTLTKKAAIGEEQWDFASSPIFFALSIIFSLTIYAPSIGYAVITILTLGDGPAKLVGKKIGKTVLPYNKTKTLEGTVVGIFVSAIASSIFVPPIQAVIASVLGLVVESMPLAVNDNITIPLSAGLLLIMIA
ncbi:MAG: HAD-IB family phosphatase, partial [Candidatus Hermodarchaeia archaeon]